MFYDTSLYGYFKSCQVKITVIGFVARKTTLAALAHVSQERRRTCGTSLRQLANKITFNSCNDFVVETFNTQPLIPVS